MSSVRKIKKAIKESNGFFTAKTYYNMCFCASEENTIKYHKDSISVNNVRCPYCFIKRLVIGG